MSGIYMCIAVKFGLFKKCPDIGGLSEEWSRPD